MRVASFNFSFFCILKWVCFKSPNKSFPGHVQKASSVSTWTSMYKWASLLSLRRCASIRLKWKENDYLKQGCFWKYKIKKGKISCKMNFKYNCSLHNFIFCRCSQFIELFRILDYLFLDNNHSHCILFTHHFT